MSENKKENNETFDNSKKYNLKKYNVLAKKNTSDIYNITINEFEGPLDLLCYLIKNNQMDINNINISEVSNQYMDYLEKMEKLNLEIASEFVVMASTLLYIKSKKVLPNKDEKEENEPTEEELVQRIVEYNKYKNISGLLKEKYEENKHKLTKPKTLLKLPNKEFTGSYDKELLAKFYKLQILKYKEKMNKKRDDIEKLVIKENVTVKSKLKEILIAFKKSKQFVFNKLFVSKKRSKQEIVVAFMAMLEMSKKDKLKINQTELFGDITVTQIADFTENEIINS